MGWPQITWLSLAALSLFCAVILDGEPKKGVHRFSVTLFSAVMTGWILWMGGFFA